MGSKWKQFAIHEIGKVVTGKTPPGTKDIYFGGNTAFLTPTDMDEAKFVTNTQRSLSKEGTHVLRNNRIQRGVAVSCIGWQMGKSMVITSPTITNQQINTVIPHEEIIDLEFLYYVLTSKRTEIFNLGATATRTPIVKKSLFEKIKFDAPESVFEQKKIAKTLSLFDDKITLNRQINQTLEQMAQTLFKSWFVDFDPVIDNALDAGNEIPEPLQTRAELRQKVRASQAFQPLPADIRALFPAEFEESELGWVPKGWLHSTLSDLARVTSGKRPPSKSDEKTDIDVIPVWGGNGVKWFTSQTLFENKYIITGRVGTLGTVYKVNEPSWASDNALVINPKNEFLFEFIYHSLNLFDIESLNSGSTQPLVTQTALNNIEIVSPSNNKILEVFQMLTGSFDDRTFNNHREIQSLTNLRDTLLPKLISGELRLDDLPDEVVTAANE